MGINDYKIFIRLTFIFIILSLCFQGMAQNQKRAIDNQFFEEDRPGWFKLKNDKELSVEELLKSQMQELGFSIQDEVRVMKSDVDDLGMTHKKFQQYHQNIPVQAAILVTHEKDGILNSFNGQWAVDMNETVGQTISPDAAIASALQYFPAKLYYWEDEASEAMLCSISDCEKETFYPDPQLVWLNPRQAFKKEGMKLCYRMEIQALDPLIWQEVYVDAYSGELIADYEIIHKHDVVGLAKTKFSGDQEIVTDSIGAGIFVLQESGRGGGIMTFNMQGSRTYGDAVDFFDEDNFWDNFNDEIDEAATDAHWGAEMTFDYLLEKHNYLGVDGEGMPLINYVHYDNNFTNAFWNGSWATFGDGAAAWNPLTSIDIVAHEFAHGITGATARLVYRNESGALNESFSDIIGAAVEYWAIPDSADWLMGEASEIDGTGFRDMENPNERNDPHTYKGNNWVTGEQDNGGVHTNSGVQNFWYVLLVDGGSGINDNDVEYEVEAIGLDAASAIAFRNLRYYLTVESTYFDARQGSLQAAADLYGFCSNEYIQTAKAWEAVGLGNALLAYDVTLADVSYPALNNCGLSDSEFPVVQIRYGSCDSTILAGSQIPIAYQVDDLDIVEDTLVLTNDLVGGDLIEYQTTQAVTGLEEIGMHELRVWLNFDQDPNATNDAVVVQVDNAIEQNVDFGLAQINEPSSNCFMAEEVVSVDLVFEGCDSIAAGTELEVYYSINGGDPVMEEYTLPQALFADQTQTYEFSAPIDFSESNGTNEIDAWVIFEDDFLMENNTLAAHVVVNPMILSRGDFISFEFGDPSLDSLYMVTSRGSDIFRSFTAAVDGRNGLQMTGGDAITYRADLRVPNDLNKWDINETLIAQVCFCVDATNSQDLYFSFDMRQSYSIAYINIFGRDIPEASAFRLLADGEQISETFHPNTYFGDPFIRYDYDLSAYNGGTVELCFETRNFLSPRFDDVGVGDNTYLDNIELGSKPVSTQNIQNQNLLKVYPNPVSNSVFVDLGETWKSNVSVQVFDPIGQIVMEQSLDQNSLTDGYEINMSNLPQGMYRLLFTDGSTQRIATFVKL